MKILYFAWLRQKIGFGEEIKQVPDHITTVKLLIEWLKTQDGGYGDAFKDVTAIKVAINQEFANFDDKIKKNDEVAFFPPVTGG